MSNYFTTEKFAPDIGERHDGKSGAVSAHRYFQITPDDPTTASEAEARANSGLPNLRESHPSNAWLLVDSVDVKRMSPLLFEADVSYSLVLGKDPNQRDPLLQPPEIEFDDTSSEQPIDVDVDGNGIQTVLHEAFDPPLSRPFGDLTITITRNVANFDPVLASTYYYVTNSDNFLGFPPGTALITKFRAKSVARDNGSIYWVRTNVIQIRRGAPITSDDKAWHLRVKAEGFYVYGPTEPGSPIWRIDRAKVNGEPSVKPVPHKVANGEQIFAPAGAQTFEQFPVEFYYFKVYQSKPFAPLGLL